MWRYLGRRLIQVPLVLLVVSLMTFLITRATPGDPVQIMLGMQTSPEAAAALVLGRMSVIETRKFGSAP